MKFKAVSPEYMKKAAGLTHEEAERLFSRMHGKLARRLESRKLQSLEAAAIQLQLEDDELHEWRQRWAEIGDRESKKPVKGD